MTPHLFQRDYTVPLDSGGRAYCMCGRPESNKAHRIEPPEDALSKRVIGEKD